MPGIAVSLIARSAATTGGSHGWSLERQRWEESPGADVPREEGAGPGISPPPPRGGRGPQGRPMRRCFVGVWLARLLVLGEEAAAWWEGLRRELLLEVGVAQVPEVMGLGVVLG